MDGGLMMELKDLLLKGDNLEIAEQLIKTIPYAKAELEYRFWKSFGEIYGKEIEALGYDPGEEDLFDNDIKTILDTIADTRKTKGGEIYFEYFIGKIKKQELYLWIGQSGGDATIYMTVGLKENDKTIKYDKWDKKLLTAIEGLGFKRSSNNKYRYLDTKLNFSDESIYLLKNESGLKEMVKLIGDEVLGIAKSIKACRELNEIIGA